MTTFGDWEPEDSWDATDTPDEQIVNLARRVALLDGHAEPRRTSLADALDEIHERTLHAGLTRYLTPRDLVRVWQLLTDIRFVRDRLP